MRATCVEIIINDMHRIGLLNSAPSFLIPWFTERFVSKNGVTHDILVPRGIKDVQILYFMKGDVFQSVTQASSDEKKNPSAPNRSRTYDLPISTSDALSLSCRRIVVARPLNHVHVTNILHNARISVLLAS